jgi:hypothetical protein
MPIHIFAIFLQMARSHRLFLLSALLVLLGTADFTKADSEDADDGVSVEVSFRAQYFVTYFF